MKGIFELKNASDLLEKLRREHKRLDDNPIDSDSAFNFFVAAEHMPEWTYPNDSSKRNELRRNVLLRVCSHVANGAKHFQAKDPRHHSVADTKREQAWFSENWGFDKWFHPNWGFQGRLVIYFDGEAQNVFREVTTVTELANKVLEFWETELQDLEPCAGKGKVP